MLINENQSKITSFPTRLLGLYVYDQLNCLTNTKDKNYKMKQNEIYNDAVDLYKKITGTVQTDKEIKKYVDNLLVATKKSINRMIISPINTSNK